MLAVVLEHGPEEEGFRRSICPCGGLGHVKISAAHSHCLILYPHAHRHGSLESDHKGIFIATAQRISCIILGTCQYNFVQRPEFHVNIPVLKKFIIEVLLGEFRIKRQQGTVFLRGVGKGFSVRSRLFAILLDLPLSCVIIHLR